VKSTVDKGFINYFGMQRFGSYSIRTHTIGKEVLRKNWTKVCHHILAQYNESDLDQKERKEKIIDLVFEKMEIGEALDLCDRRDRLEKALLTVLKKGGGSFFTAF
jgi:tRNA pseudouridine13 synthase